MMYFLQNLAYWTFWDIYNTGPFIITIVATKSLSLYHMWLLVFKKCALQYKIMYLSFYIVLNDSGQKILCFHTEPHTHLLGFSFCIRKWSQANLSIDVLQSLGMRKSMSRAFCNLIIYTMFMCDMQHVLYVVFHYRFMMSWCVQHSSHHKIAYNELIENNLMTTSILSLILSTVWSLWAAEGWLCL